MPKEGLQVDVSSELNFNNMTEEMDTFQSLAEMALTTLSVGVQMSMNTKRLTLLKKSKPFQQF